MAGVTDSQVPQVALESPLAPVIAPGRAPRRLRAARRRRQTVIRVVVLVVVGVFFALPLVGLADFSTRQGNHRDWSAWKTLVDFPVLNQQAPDLISGLWVTLALCAITSVLTVALLVPTMTWVRIRVPALRRVVEFICLLPLTIPAIVLVVGLGWVYRGIAHVLSTGSIWLCFAYVILALPFSYRSIDAGLSAIDVKTLSEAARSLGCSWSKVMWRIVVPNIRTAILGAVFLSVALVLGEFTVAYLLLKNNLAVALYTLGLNSSGDPKLTTAVSLTMLVVAFLLMFAFSFVGNGSRRSRRASRPAAGPVNIPLVAKAPDTP